jgi:hypothetical protein
MIRILLKAFSPLEILERAILRRFHFLLPDLLRFQRKHSRPQRTEEGIILGQIHLLEKLMTWLTSLSLEDECLIK